MLWRWCDTPSTLLIGFVGMSTILDRPSRVSVPVKRSTSPRSNGHRPPKWRVWLRRFFIVSSIGLFLAICAGAAALTWAWNSVEIPAEKPLAQTTFITDSKGSPLASLAAENRVPVELSQVPHVVQQAVLDTEDHDYFKHHGVDPRGVTRALWNDLRDRNIAQGGSTITQQYVKKTYVGEERTAVRKVKEAVLALKLERKYSKEEILQRYLNTIYFGRGAYGVQTAARAYYGKDIQELTLREATYLAGLIRAPELADAYGSPEVAVARRDSTLASMVRFGTITPEQSAVVAAQPLQTYVIPRARQEPAITNGDKGTQYFVDYVRRILIQRYGEERVLSGGLRVTTTIDIEMQRQAYDSVYGFLKPNEPAGALVTLDRNGEIRAMVGGRDWNQSKVNLAIGKQGGGSGRQAGSTYKPIVLAAALEDGMSIRKTFSGPSTMTLNVPGGPWKVSNYGNESFGRLDLIEATVHSVNTVYAQLAVAEGPKRMSEMGKSLGITSEMSDVHSLVLGSGEVSVLDMANAYLTFSQRGVQSVPGAILEVKNADGDVLERFKPERKRVMSEGNADLVNHALQQVMQRGTGTRAQIGKPAAGKTGTTEDSGDAWFVGYTPTLSTAVWMGYTDGASHKLRNVRGIAEVTGGTLPAQMWGSYMRQVTAAAPPTPFADAKLPAPPTTIAETTTTSPSNDVVNSTTTIVQAGQTTTTTPGRGGDSEDGKADRGSGRDRDRNDPIGRQKDDPGPLITIPKPTQVDR